MKITDKILKGGCLLTLVIGISCKSNAPGQAMFELQQNTGINFENTVKDGKLENSFLFRNFYNGGGVALGDINNDGLPDVILTSNMGENKLYLNKGNFLFEDITAKSGFVQDSMWSTGVVLADVNSDGWLDAYICNSGHMSNGNRKNRLYINNHNLSFTESGAEYGLDHVGYSTQASFFDYDLDGDLDCFIIDNSPIPVNTLNFANRRDLPESEWHIADFLKGGGNHLLKNNNGHFIEVTTQAGIHCSLISFGLGVSVGDINNDGYPDIYVSNDSYERDYLYINQRDGTFKDELEQWMQHTSMSSMGADLADINNDGYPDVFTTDMLPDEDYRLKTTGSFENIDLYNSKLKAGFYHQYVKNCLQLNNQNGKFLDIANYSGVSASDWSWGALIFDADNDGWNDIYVCNGVNRDVIDLDFLDFFASDFIQKMVLSGKKENVNEVLQKVPQHPLRNKMFRNQGNLTFKDIGNTWGFSQPSFSNGAAYADLDNDGDLDLVVNNESGPAFIYKNNARELTANNYLALSLKGTGDNTFAIGSKIQVYCKGQVYYRELVPSRGFQSSVDYKEIIGIGKNTVIDSVTITWPNRSVSKYQQPRINTNLVLQEPAEQKAPAIAEEKPIGSTILSPVNVPFEKHQEDEYTDFYFERNLPVLLSREGPHAAYGDVNGDKLTDIYIGGTPNHAGQLYLQNPDGSFIKKTEPVFGRFIDFEDVPTIFFDADHDGDLDLFIGPGGNNNPAYSRQMQNRLFKNDGHGNFTLDDAAFVNNSSGMNASVALAYDFNGDGFLDLFVGGRSVPREYGSVPSSYIYINDGAGHFTDIAETRNKEIAHIGLVTGAVCADINGDKEKELVITGEWMTPRVFSFKAGLFKEIKTNLSTMYGWWKTVTAADLDGDGREDLILGNIGENFYLHPDSLNPVKLWLNDYDQNNSADKIITYTVGGKDMPVFLKHDMEDQLPSLKKQNLKHRDFAKKSIQELFPAEILNKAVVKIFNYPASCIAFSAGNGNFRVQKLPPVQQMSSINAINCTDLNGDGLPDIVSGGNEFGFPPQFGRLDASYGNIMLNKGKGQFEVIHPRRSGLNLPGQVRDIVSLSGNNGSFLLFLQNNEYPVLYKIQK